MDVGVNPNALTTRNRSIGATRDRWRSVRARVAAATAVPLTIAAVFQLTAGTLTSKLVASMVGADGVGVLAVVQAFGNLMAVLTLGTGYALIREHGRTERDSGTAFAELRLSMELTTAIALVVFCLPGLLLARPIANATLGPGETNTFVLALFAGAVYTWTTIQVSTLIAARAVRPLAMALVLGAASTPLIAFIGYRTWGIDAIGGVALASSCATLVTTLTVMRRRLPRERMGRAGIGRAIAYTPRLIRFGTPQILGTVVTAGVTLLVPVIARRSLGVTATGHYRAAFTIALGMATVFGFLLGGDFAARIAAAATNEKVFIEMLANQLRSLALWAGGAALSLTMTGPLLVRVLYSGEFDPSNRILALALCAQFLGLLATAINLAVAARYGSTVMFVVTALAGALTVTLCAALARQGLEALAAAYLVGQAVWLAASIVLLTARSHCRWPNILDRDVMWVAAIIAALVFWPHHHALSALIAAAGLALRLRLSRTPHPTRRSVAADL